MNFDFEDLGNMFDAPGEEPSDDSLLENNWALFNSSKEFVVIAIDCHVSMFSRGVETKNSLGGKQTVSQLSYILETVTNFLRSQIISQPTVQYCVMFYNTGHFGDDGDGIYMFKHAQSQASRTANTQPDAPLGMLTKDYIKKLIKVESLGAFSQHIGFSPYLEGTTPFASLVQTIQHVFSTIPPQYQAASLATNGTVDKKVILFTAIDDPCYAPSYIYNQRLFYYEQHLSQLRSKLAQLESSDLPTAADEAASINAELMRIHKPTFRGGDANLNKNAIQMLCKRDYDQACNRLESTGDDKLITWMLYPVPSALPLIQNVPQTIKNIGSTTMSGSDSTSSAFNINSLAQQVFGKLHSFRLDQLSLSQPSSQNSAKSAQPCALQTSAMANAMSNVIYGIQPQNRSNPGQLLDDTEDNVQVSLSPQDTETITSMSALLSLYPDDREFLNHNLQTSFIQTAASLLSANPSLNFTLDTSSDVIKQEPGIKSEGGSLMRKVIQKEKNKLQFLPSFYESVFPESNIEHAIENHRILMREFRELKQIKTHPKRSLCTVPIIFPTQSLPMDQQSQDDINGYFFGVDIHPQFIETKVQASTDVKLDPIHQIPISSKTKLLSVTGEELTPRDIQHYFPFGGNEVVFFPRSQVSQTKNFGPGSLRILGFREHKGTYRDLIRQIRWSDNIQRSYRVHPSDIKYPGSNAAFADFVHTLYVLNRFVVAQFIPKTGAMPRLVYLIPQIETTHPNEEKTPTALQLIFLPFSDDIRLLDLPGQFQATTPNHIIEAIDRVVDGYLQNTIIKRGIKKEEVDQDPELELDDAFYITTDTPSFLPLQLRTALVESLALGIMPQTPVDELSLPPEKRHIDALLEEVYALLLEEHTHFGPAPKTTRGKKAAAKDENDEEGSAPAPKARARAKKGVVTDVPGGSDEEVPAPAAKKRGRRAAAIDDNLGVIKDEEEEQIKPKRVYNRKKKDEEEEEAPVPVAAKKRGRKAATNEDDLIIKEEEKEIKPKRNYNRKKKDEEVEDQPVLPRTRSTRARK